MSKHQPLAAAAPSKTSEPEPQYDSLFILVTRLYWFGFGPIFAALLLIACAQDVDHRFGVLDVAYFIVLTLIPLARWFEFRLGKAETGAGQPLTWTHLRNYMLVVIGVGIAAWLIATELSRVFLPSA